MRSSEWFAGDDEVAVAHRVALRSSGLDIQPNDPRPIIGIADSSSDLNPCNLPLRALAETVSAGVKAAGAVVDAVIPDKKSEADKSRGR